MSRVARVEKYTLRTAAGRHIRRATKVVFEDGHEVKFVDLVPAGLARAQAIELRAKGVS